MTRGTEAIGRVAQSHSVIAIVAVIVTSADEVIAVVSTNRMTAVPVASLVKRTSRVINGMGDGRNTRVKVAMGVP